MKEEALSIAMLSVLDANAEDNTTASASLLGFYAMAGHAHVMQHRSLSAASQNLRTETPSFLPTSDRSHDNEAFVLRARFVLKENGFLPSLADFEHAVLNANAYPRTGRFLGFPVDLFEKSVILKPAAHAGDDCIIYQKTGASDMFNVTSRHYVLKMRVAERSPERTRIEWSLFDHERENGRFHGDFASILNSGKEDAIYTPDNRGYWDYSRANRSINFGVAIDIGIPVTHPKLFQKLLTVLPQTLLSERWQIEDFDLFAVI